LRFVLSCFLCVEPITDLPLLLGSSSSYTSVGAIDAADSSRRDRDLDFPDRADDDRPREGYGVSSSCFLADCERLRAGPMYGVSSSCFLADCERLRADPM